MSTTSERDRYAEEFRALHRTGRVLVLANAWDAASARMFELAGAPAIATTSAGVAVSLGFPDGNHLPRGLAMEALARIVAAVRVPVSADIEAGYGTDPGEVVETVRQVIEAGAVGINLEDGVEPPDVLVAKLETVRAATERMGAPLFVNARIDTYLNGGMAPAAALEESLRRAARYTAAGADGIFVPAVVDRTAIRTLVREVGAPLNVLAVPGLPAPAELSELGVARLSVGSGPMRAALTFTRSVAEALLDRGDYRPFLDGVLSHAEVNRLIARA